MIGWFMPPEKSSAKDKWLLFLLGAFGLYGFMFLYLAGLSKTTPVSSSIFYQSAAYLGVSDYDFLL